MFNSSEDAEADSNGMSAVPETIPTGSDSLSGTVVNAQTLFSPFILLIVSSTATAADLLVSTGDQVKRMGQLSFRPFNCGMIEPSPEFKCSTARRAAIAENEYMSKIQNIGW